jgi:hypothetical protein
MQQTKPTISAYEQYQEAAQKQPPLRNHEIEKRRYLPTLAELIDRLAIVQLKEIHLSEHRDEYRGERALIMHDIDLLLKERAPLDAKDVHAIAVLMAANLTIWNNESKARAGGNDQDHLLKFTHSINGVRSTAKNVLSRNRERQDFKIDCLAESIPSEFGSWKIF